MAFHEVPIESLEFNPFKKISKQWMLITAGDEKKSNTMTASWGGLGIMWGKNVATAIHPPKSLYRRISRSTRSLSQFSSPGGGAYSSGVLWDTPIDIMCGTTGRQARFIRRRSSGRQELGADRDDVGDARSQIPRGYSRSPPRHRCATRGISGGTASA